MAAFLLSAAALPKRSMSDKTLTADGPSLRRRLAVRGAGEAVPSNAARTVPHLSEHEARACHGIVEFLGGRPKSRRRTATRCDRLALNCLAALASVRPRMSGRNGSPI